MDRDKGLIRRGGRSGRCFSVASLALDAEMTALVPNGTVVPVVYGYTLPMTDPKSEPSREMKKADAANGEPEALEDEKHKTGEAQAEENKSNESPA
jgi:hypothetical protein